MLLVWKLIIPCSVGFWHHCSTPVSQVLAQSFHHHTLFSVISSFVLVPCSLLDSHPCLLILPLPSSVNPGLFTGFIYFFLRPKMHFDTQIPTVSSKQLICLFQWVLSYGFTLCMLILKNFFGLIQFCQKKCWKLLYWRGGGVGRVISAAISHGYSKRWFVFLFTVSVHSNVCWS